LELGAERLDFHGWLVAIGLLALVEIDLFYYANGYEP